MAVDIYGDLRLTDDGDIQLARGVEAAEIRIFNRLAVNQGEWAFNLQFGVPWLYSILGQAVDNAAGRELIAQAIQSDFEVEAVGEVQSFSERGSREVSLQIQVQLVDGLATVTV